jgi:membrane fusion protein (multidrug efflux system)
MLIRMVIMLILVFVVIGLIFGFQTFKGIMIKKFMASMGDQPETVGTYTVADASWQNQLIATGSLRALRGADLSLEVAGIVDTVDFESGVDVRAGQTLLTLKPNDDPAKLQQLQATAQLDEITYKRDQQQFAAQAVSQATLDTDVANLKNARAQVAAQQALIQEKILKAPFAGRLGIRQVDQGQYLSSGTVIVTLQELDPIVVDFYVPQQSLAQLKVGEGVSAAIDTYPGQAFKGTITSINAKVDSASRNIQVRASFHNTDHRLLPGMYANVSIDSGAPHMELTVPQTAITYNPYGDTVFVVTKQGVDAKGNPKLVAQQRFVTLSDTRGDQVAISKGLKAGEVVVIAGQMKLHNGSPVVINNQLLPSNDVNPTPPNS